MSVEKSLLGKLKDGKDIYAYTITNKNGMSAVVMTYGAILRNLYVPGKKGETDDVVLGFDQLYRYQRNTDCFGSTIGPICNRTEKGEMVMGKKVYNLAINDRKLNNLHTDLVNGFHHRHWDAAEGKNAVTFSLVKKDGEMGHPGTMKVSVTYTLTDKNELKITYHAESNKNTLVNMTNHSYFNLSGKKSDSIEKHKLTLHASKFVPVRKDAIPTGELKDVKGTAFDFTKGKLIGKDVNDFSDKQLKQAHGYDHNWCIDGYNGKLKSCALVEDAKSGRSMEVFTDLPGVQFYAGNWIGNLIGKDGRRNCKRKGLCLETQYYPGSAGKSDFFCPVVGPGKPYDTTTIYKFNW